MRWASPRPVPRCCRAYQRRDKLRREIVPAHWGKLKDRDGIKYYKIDLHLQRLTSLKLFPAAGECPFLGPRKDDFHPDTATR